MLCLDVTEFLRFSLSRMTLQRNILRHFACYSLQMKVTRPNKSLASACHTTWCHIPAESYLSSKRHMDVRSRMYFLFYLCASFGDL